MYRDYGQQVQLNRQVWQKQMLQVKLSLDLIGFCLQNEELLNLQYHER